MYNQVAGQGCELCKFLEVTFVGKEVRFLYHPMSTKHAKQQGVTDIEPWKCSVSFLLIIIYKNYFIHLLPNDNVRKRHEGYKTQMLILCYIFKQ